MNPNVGAVSFEKVVAERQYVITSPLLVRPLVVISGALINNPDGKSVTGLAVE